jgi:hypothetical protein
VQLAAEHVGQSAARVSKAAKELRRAAVDGDLLRMRRAMDALADRTQEVHEASRVAAESWRLLDEDQVDEYLAGPYNEELELKIREAGLPIQRVEGRLAVFPNLIRIFPRERAIRIGRRKFARLRPSAVVELLRRGSRARSKPETFLALVRKTYLLLTGAKNDGCPVPLDRVFAALTIHPAAKAQYELADFLRDLFELESSGIEMTRDGRRLRLIAPSSASRDRKGYELASPTGELRYYYAISFEGGTDGALAQT